MSDHYDTFWTDGDDDSYVDGQVACGNYEVCTLFPHANYPTEAHTEVPTDK